MNGPRIGTSELIDLLLSLGVLTIAFSARRNLTPEVLAISAIGVGTGFLLHELAHKFVAQRYGYWAEYKANPMGLILTVIMAFFIGIVFAAPGAVMIRKGASSTPMSSYSPDSDDYWDHLERKAGGEELWIALAGPVTNIILAAFFFSLTMTGFITNDFLLNVASYAFFINMSLAAFNLIPFDPLDGAKIFRGNALIWTIVAVPTILFALYIITRSLGMI
jgi:Zn-dependent protease